MAEYRIVAKIDPQTAAGSAKVKQDLQGIQTQAKATETALNRSFDQAKFDKTIGSLVGRLDQLEKGLTNAGQTAQKVGKSFDTTTGGLERMTAAEFRAAGGLDGLSNSASGAATSQAQLDAALRRVLTATDAEAAGQLRLNNLVGDSTKLLAANLITQETHNKVLAQAAALGKEQASVSGMQRIGMQQLGFQLGDVATMYSLGAKPAQIFGSQIGQITQAVQLMSGGTSKFASFLGGPWGIALSVGLIALTPLIGKLFETGNAADEARKKLEEDARQTEATRVAKEAFALTLAGVTAAIHDQNEELKKGQTTARQAELDAYALAKAHLQTTVNIRAATEAQIANNKAMIDAQAIYMRSPNAAKDGIDGSARMSNLQDEQVRVQTALTDATNARVHAEEALRRAEIPINERAVAETLDKSAAATGRYEVALQRLREERAKGLITQEAYVRADLAAAVTRDRAIAAAQKEAQVARASPSDGVSRFRSREQAIGIAGREFQKAGFDVSGNKQFRTTTGHANDADHNRNAIDINSSARPGVSTGGIVEANVPDLKAKFDAMARRYQARGYQVLWNGQVWPAGGSGPSGPITGADKHYDHMHVYAPETIVGKSTGASTESQVAQDEGSKAKVAERASDFVQSIADKAAAQDVAPDRQSQLNAQIDEALAEFTRRFDRAATTGEKASITKSLTDADARQIAIEFDKAYVDPLKRLQELQGKTGLDRQVLNAQLEETLRLGRALTFAEAQRIDTGIRGSAQLQTTAQILEQINGPVEAYKAQLTSLNALLSQGSISQAEFNARIGELGASASQFKAGLPGNNSQGTSFADQGAAEEAQRQRDDQLAQLETFLNEGNIKEAEAADIRVAIWRQYQERLRQIDDSRLNNARGFFGQLAQLSSSKNKELAAIGKAAAVTAATIDAYLAINKALATLPPPWNIAMAAAIGATALANVAQIVGLKDGGIVRGPGGPRSDSVPINASNGEFVVNAAATGRNLALLEAINAGKTVRAAAPAAMAAAGAAQAAPAAAASPPPEVNLRIVNVTSNQQMSDFLASPEGEQVFVNMLHSNPEIIRQIASN